MFLDITQQKNPALLEAGVYFHQKGLIDPNTYLIDLDAVRANAANLSKEAHQQKLKLYFMTKQIGRNPLVSQAIMDAGISKAVAVDPWEAIALANHGIPIGHIGHLVQIPKNMIGRMIDLEPEQITVFSYENAKVISDIATSKGKKQNILLRMVSQGDFLYPGQKGGIHLDRMDEEVGKIERLSGVNIIGVTSFPCLSVEDNSVKPASNFKTINKAANYLRSKGYQNVQVNAPSANASKTLSLIKEHGGTQGEPGHALTGTTPLHTDERHPEIPAMVYVSEVSHKFDHQSYVFGGGFYPRSHVQRALVGHRFSEMAKAEVIPNDPGNIDYYGTLNVNESAIGDTALFAFRTQIFVTNAQVAIVTGVNNHPKIAGIYDAMGNILSNGEA
ncbi:alanine racemase [Tuberibacillus sp. Marseille-P3662]|uniref:alanine racemase n=1 Tax=Tuberibacillus sp. Marseille-P3662 TaxID=1965358 RepID=UPI000A1CB8E6|nr:alanine racemase [Tuberibacillus sp. Marseille-P3662]